MKRLLLIFCLFITYIAIFAQKQYVGFEGGLNFTNIKIDYPFKNEYRNRILFGINYELSLKNKFSIGAELLYNQKGYKENFLIWDNVGGAIYSHTSNYYIKYSYNYLTIPLKFGYSFGRNFFVSPKCGIYTSYLMKAISIIPKTDYLYEPTGDYYTQNDKDKVSKLDFGGLIELECGYTFDDLIVFSCFSYTNSLTPVTIIEYYYHEKKIRHFGISLSLGMKYLLK